MTVIICPGAHSPHLTQEFLREMSAQLRDAVVFPAERYPAYSAWHLIQFLEETLEERQCDAPILLIGFSAGVVAAIATAWYWQFKGRTVRALIALDGWGVPLRGRFPIHRISHDEFTHWSSSLGEHLSDCFYADPPVEHLNLWRSPSSATGQWIRQSTYASCRIHPLLPPPALTTRTTAAEFMGMLLQTYGYSE
ncbi:MAG: hypothetical protein VKL39_22330 [Leptolyngbyaceae bacterium]|nr:hypothetical protein [Leptolyngbyaceae bacterium]